MFYICKWLVWIAMKIAFSVKLEGKENIPKDTNCIFASNHRTNADPPLISCGLKGKHSFMAKEEWHNNNDDLYTHMLLLLLSRVSRVRLCATP